MEEMEERRRRMKETLERMERLHCDGKGREESEREVVEKLRREGAVLLEKEQEEVLAKFKKIHVAMLVTSTTAFVTYTVENSENTQNSFLKNNQS